MSFKLCAFADEADKSLDGQIRALSENGILQLEIRGVDGENISVISAAKAKEIKNKLEDSGISVWSIGSPMGKIKITEDFTPHLDMFRRVLDVAHILGARAFRLFSFYIPENEKPELYRDEVMERLSLFAAAARESDIALCHENEKKIYGDTAARCLEIHKAVPELYAVFDPANFVQCGEDTLAAWDLLSPYVYYMHIKDALFSDGSVVPAGCGDGNIPALIKKYAAVGEVLTLEPHLKVFHGLAELEDGVLDNKVKTYTYKNNRAAFDAAVRALRDLI